MFEQKFASQRRTGPLVRHSVHHEVLVIAHHHSLVEKAAAKSGIVLNVLQSNPVRLNLNRRVLNRNPAKA
jgi:hypothetical protein